MSPAELIDAVTGRFQDAVLSSYIYRDDATVVAEREAVHDIARFLKEDPALSMNFLTDLTAVDYSTFGKSPTPAFFASSGVTVSPSLQIPDKDPWPGPPDEARFAVVYHFFSTAHKHRLRLVTPVPATGEGPDSATADVDSLTDLWPGANWLEREVWDMFGISFRGHPDLKRILMYDEFEGHPLRKDYPVNRRQPLIGPLN